MSSDRKAARIFGGLFLLTFVTSIAGALLYGPVLDHEDYIVKPAATALSFAFGSMAAFTDGRRRRLRRRTRDTLGTAR